MDLDEKMAEAESCKTVGTEAFKAKVCPPQILFGEGGVQFLRFTLSLICFSENRFTSFIDKDFSSAAREYTAGMKYVWENLYEDSEKVNAIGCCPP